MDVYKSKSLDLLFKIETLIFVNFDDNPEEDLTWHMAILGEKSFIGIKNSGFCFPKLKLIFLFINY